MAASGNIFRRFKEIQAVSKDISRFRSGKTFSQFSSPALKSCR